MKNWVLAEDWDDYSLCDHVRYMMITPETLYAQYSNFHSSPFLCMEDL